MPIKKKLVVIIAVGAAAFLGGLYYLSTLVETAGDNWPYENEPGSLVAKMAAAQQEIRTQRDNVAKIPAAQETLDKLKVDYDLAMRVLPRENSPDQLLAAIRTKALEVGITPDTIVPSTIKPSGGGGFEEWTFSLSLAGTYDQLAYFVNRMEEFESNDAARTGSEKRFFRVSNINITAQDSGMGFIGNPGETGRVAGQARHQCSLTMQTYRYAGAL